MKEQMKEMFEQVTMPEETEKKIRRAMAQAAVPAEKNGQGLRRIAAVAGILALILLISPTARAVGNLVVKYIFPESGITVYEETDESGNVTNIMAVDTEVPAFAEIREGRLYFTGNGQNIDITDRVTEEEPYYYTFTDDYGLVHYMVVGYSGSIENYGIYEFLREDQEGQKDWEGWSNGTGRNFLDPETGTAYPWVKAVWEELALPWPMPGE